MNEEIKIEELKSKDYACAYSIFPAAGKTIPQGEWIAKVRKWQGKVNGLERGIKVIRNKFDYIVACISYRVEISKKGEKFLLITGILIPNMFKKGIVKYLTPLFEKIAENLNCSSVVVAFPNNQSFKPTLFENQHIPITN